MDWLTDDRAADLDHGRPRTITAPDERSRRSFRVPLVLTVVALALIPALWFLLSRQHHETPTQQAEPQAAPSTTAPSEDAAASNPPSSSTSSAAPRLTGAPLANAWLRAYLTRPAGEQDTSWAAAIAPYSTPELVNVLRSADDLGKLAAMKAMSVKAIRPAKTPHPPSTQTRQVSSWLVDVTDGKTTATRQYTLTAYVDATGRWTVAEADPAYTSEG